MQRFNQFLKRLLLGLKKFFKGYWKGLLSFNMQDETVLHWRAIVGTFTLWILTAYGFHAFVGFVFGQEAADVVLYFYVTFVLGVLGYEIE